MKENLKSIFALPKWAKIFLAVLSVVAVAGLITAFGLKAWAADKVESGELVLNGIDKGMQERLDSGFAYDGRLYFARLDFLLRSKVIAYIDIQGISWAENVDKNAISEITSQNRHIKFITSQDLQGLNAQNIGKVEYKMDFSPLFKTIIKYYFAIAFFVLAVQILWNFFVITWRSLPPKIDTTANSLNLKPLTRKDYAFLGFAFVLCVGICAFTFWLGFPGFHIIGDTYNSIALVKNDAHPVFIAYIMQLLYVLFGKHLFYLFLFNLVPFYLGLFFLIAGFYIRFRNPFSLLLIFPTFIGNIYFQNFIEYHSFSLPMMLFCLYSLVLFLVLVPFWKAPQSKALRRFAKFLWGLLFVLMFFAILWRHNAIFSVFPAFFVLCYIFLKNRGLNSKAFLKRYIQLVALSAVLCLVVSLGVPKILAKGESYPANHPFLHQIAGACVPADDAKCFKDEWYYPHKNFENVKDLYAKYPLNADPFNVTWGYDDERPFKPEKLKGLKTQWLKSILKYPLNFLSHEMRFFKAMWWQNPAWLFDSQTMQKIATHEWHLSVIKDFPKNERSIVLTPLKLKIYDFIFAHKFTLNHIVGVGVGLVVLVACSVILWRRRKEMFADNAPSTLLIFSFSVSFACFFSAVFIAAFTPVPETRYMSPILPLAIVALIGFFAFVVECFVCRKVE